MLLGGYNTMSPAQREKIDKVRLSKIAGNMLLRMFVEFLLLGIASYLDITWAVYALVAVFIVDLIASIIILNRKTENPSTDNGITKSTSASTNKADKTAHIVSTALTAALCVGMGIMIFFGAKSPEVQLSGGTVEIKSMYGVGIDFAQISNITLIEQSMTDIGPGKRDNGYGGIGSILKGHFSSKDLGKYLLFVDSKASPTIKIERSSGEDIYLNFSDEEKTLTLYRELTQEVSPNA
jgi:hypothetical protein